ncbi:uncharacterized protein LOC129940057 [Eupeodes corollae]|uniref:uncharacterized protein LOC129940057 n=1 Tax=Eupeodes corollae TaxID=290404 RepID=UPI0024913E52|nr:uncharacterized protein LOC129940057 [Eupeodes corollae]
MSTIAADPDYSKQLENQMENMRIYLEKLVQSDEVDESINGHKVEKVQGFAGIPNLIQRTHPDDITHDSYLQPAPLLSGVVQPTTAYNYGLVGASPQYTKTMITSVLANPSNLKSSTPKFVNYCCPRTRRRISNKQPDIDPDTSGIDIDATMIELGLTPEALTKNRVHKLFSLFSDLEFSIHAEFITTTVYDEKTIPNTLSVSAQTKYAVWSSHKLLRSLREVLKRPMPAEYKSAYAKCEEALGQLQQAITNLERFKYCTLEHRKGDFIAPDAEEYLQPLMAALNHLTERVEKTRMYVQVYERALNAPERYKAALLASREEDHRQPLPEERSTEATTSNNRPQVARRYIG